MPTIPASLRWGNIVTCNDSSLSLWWIFGSFISKKNIHSPTHRIHGTGIFAYIYHKKWTIHEGIHILESYGSPTAPFHPSNQPTSTQRIIIQPHRYPSTRKVCPTFRWCLGGRFGDLRPSPLVVTWDPADSQGHDASFFWMGPIPFFVGA